MNVNAARAIPPEQIGRAISQVLLEWADNEEKEFVKAIDEAADACNETVKGLAPVSKRRRAGTYRNSFTVERGWQERHYYTAEWHAEAPEYRLTHLLENGHLTRDGTTRTRAVKHIKHGRQRAEQVLNEQMAGLWDGG